MVNGVDNTNLNGINERIEWNGWNRILRCIYRGDHRRLSERGCIIEKE